MAIPNKLIISTFTVDKSPLKEVILKFPTVFEQEKTEEGDFNKLAIFILYQRL